MVRYPLTQRQGEEEEEIGDGEVVVLFPRLILFFTKKRTSERVREGGEESEEGGEEGERWRETGGNSFSNLGYFSQEMMG